MYSLKSLSGASKSSAIHIDYYYNSGLLNIHGTLEVSGTPAGITVKNGSYYNGYASIYLERAWHDSWDSETQTYDREHRRGQLTGTGLPAEMSGKPYDATGWRWRVDQTTGSGKWMPINIIASNGDVLLAAASDTALTDNNYYDYSYLYFTGAGTVIITATRIIRVGPHGRQRLIGTARTGDGIGCGRTSRNTETSLSSPTR
jgi:hypothetical protein